MRAKRPMNEKGMGTTSRTVRTLKRYPPAKAKRRRSNRGSTK